MKAWVIAMGLCAPQMLWAQKMTGIELDRTRVAVDEVTNVQIDFDLAGSIWCGMRVNFGDGTGRDLRVEQAPLVLKKSYAMPGTYTVTAEGKTLVRGLKTAFACLGAPRPKQVVIFDPVAEEAASKAESERQRLAREVAEREAKLKQDAIALAKRKEEEQRRANAAKPGACAASGVKRPI